ncbi:MAG: 3-keto-5-aminohexanoate cleavage protein [Nitrospinota bacterium]
MEKLVITAALTGSRITREQSPFIPLTPEEIVEEAVRAHEAGAAMVHIHVRDPETGLGTQSLGLFRQVTRAIEERCDVIQCLTTSGIPGRNLPEVERRAPLELNPEIASFDAGSMNFGPLLYICSPDWLERLAGEMLERGVVPELEIFDTGMMGTCLRLIEKGLIRKPYVFQFVLGIQTGAPATASMLSLLVNSLPEGSVWFVAGIGRAQLPMALSAMTMGGHVRVGLEDNLYYTRGVLAKSSAEQVARIVRLAGELGREVATPDEARALLGIRKREGPVFLES